MNKDAQIASTFRPNVADSGQHLAWLSTYGPNFPHICFAIALELEDFFWDDNMF